MKQNMSMTKVNFNLTVISLIYILTITSLAAQDYDGFGEKGDDLVIDFAVDDDIPEGYVEMDSAMIMKPFGKVVANLENWQIVLTGSPWNETQQFTLINERDSLTLFPAYTKKTAHDSTKYPILVDPEAKLTISKISDTKELYLVEYIYAYEEFMALDFINTRLRVTEIWDLSKQQLLFSFRPQFTDYRTLDEYKTECAYKYNYKVIDDGLSLLISQLDLNHEDCIFDEEGGIRSVSQLASPDLVEGKYILDFHKGTYLFQGK